MNLNWLEQSGKTFLDIVPVIRYTKNEAILQTSFVNNLLLAYWDKFSSISMQSFFIPFLLFMLALIHFMVAEMSEFVKEDTVWWHVYYYPFFGFIVVTLLNKIMIEVTQLKNIPSLAAYFTNYFKIIDLSLLTLTIIFLVFNYLYHEDYDYLNLE